MAPTLTDTTNEPDRPSATPAGPLCSVSAELERSLTQVARAILRLGVPQSVLGEGESIDKAGYWLLVRVAGEAPLRLSELAGSVELDLSTVSRQIRDLVSNGLVIKEPDPDDGRASLLSLSPRGLAVLDAVSEARRQVLAEAIVGWSEEERASLTGSLLRLEAGLHQSKEHRVKEAVDRPSTNGDPQ